MMVVVVVVVVVDDPATHLPPTKVRPSLLEQVLQATPPSLKVNEYDPGGQVETQALPLGMRPFPQLEHTFPGSTPNAMYTIEKSSTVLEAVTVRMKLLSMDEVKSRGRDRLRATRFNP